MKNKEDIQIISKQLVEVEEAIEAIDSHRRQINQRLIEIQESIQLQYPNWNLRVTNVEPVFQERYFG